MTLTGIHFLLTYQCTYECDHCFINCSPEAEGTFTVDRINAVLNQAKIIGTVTRIFYEGGEPFLFYSTLLEGVRAASSAGFEVGIVTNAYWATSLKDAELGLEPLVEAGLTDLSISDDQFHSGETGDEKPEFARKSAENLGINAGVICIEKPTVITDYSQEKGQPIIGGSTRFKGRAADKLTEGLPTQPAAVFDKCLDEDLQSPSRVHVDSYGNVHICQGISMGNMWDRPLSELIRRYDHTIHPICNHLHEGGPAQLASENGIKFDHGFVSECHLCYFVRKQLRQKFPQQLTPAQVYG